MTVAARAIAEKKTVGAAVVAGSGAAPILIYPRLAVALREERPWPLHLLVRQPKQVAQPGLLTEPAIRSCASHQWVLTLAAAMRHSEIVRVRFDEIDFGTRRIWINKAKAGEREQPITPALADALRRQRDMVPDATGYVFPGKPGTKREHRRDMRVPFERAVARAGLDPRKVTPHVMRHTAITRLVQAGVNIPTIQRTSGHETVAMVLHSTHVRGLHIDNAIGTLDAGFAAAFTPELHTPAKPDELETGKVVGISAAKSAA